MKVGMKVEKLSLLCVVGVEYGSGNCEKRITLYIEGNGAGKGYSVLSTLGELAALDEWMPQKVQRLLAGNA